MIKFLVCYQDDATDNAQYDIEEKYPTPHQAMKRYQELINSFFNSPNRRNELPFISLWAVDENGEMERCSTFTFDWYDDED